MVLAASFSFKIGRGSQYLVTLLEAVLTWSGYWNKNYRFCQFQEFLSRFLTFKWVSWSSQCVLDYFQSKKLWFFNNFWNDFSDFFFLPICSFRTSSSSLKSPIPYGSSIIVFYKKSVKISFFRCRPPKMEFSFLN